MDETPLVYTAAHLYSKIIYSNKDYLLASNIIAGWDPKFGAQIYAVATSGSLVPIENYYGTGSGMAILRGYLEAGYRPNMSYEEAKQLLINSISLSIKRDVGSGGSIRLSKICKEELTEELIEFNLIPHWEVKK